MESEPYWLQLITPKEQVIDTFWEFLGHYRKSATQDIVWDTLKAYLRGIIIQQISRKKKIH